MASVTDIQKARRGRKRKKQIRQAGFLLGAAVLAVTVMLLSDWIASLDPLFILRNLFMRGAGFPATVSGSYVAGSLGYRGCPGVLTDAGFTLYTASADPAAVIRHAYSDPVARVAGNKILLYDRGGKSIKLCTRGGELWSKTAPYTIICAAVDAQGQVAVSMGAQGYVTQVVVYGPEGLVRYTWYSLEDYSRDIFLNSRGMAVVGISTSGADVVTNVRTFRFDSAEPQSHAVIDALALRSDAVGQSVRVLTEGGVCDVADGAVTAEVDFGGRGVLGYDVAPDGFTAVALQKGSSTRADTVLLLDRQLKAVGEIPLDFALKAMSVQNGRVLLLGHGELHIYDRAGVLKEVRAVPSSAETVLDLYTGTYLLSRREVLKL